MLEALTVDAAASDVLFGRPFCGRVHSVFAKAVNFTGPDDNLYCLAAEELDDAPNTVRVRRPAGTALDGLGIQPGDEVATAAGGLACGPVPVKAAAVRPWSAPLPPFPGDPAGSRRLATNLDALRAAIVAAGRVGGLRGFIAGTAATAFERELAARAAALAAAAGAGDKDGIVAAGRRLVGLGTGLTPSGDDFLAGLMIVFNLPDGPFGRACREAAVALAAGAETGTVSRSMLGHAARGRTGAGVVALLAALTGGSQEDVAAAALHVLDCGATSGTDLAAGLAAGLTTGLTIAGEREE